MVLLATVSKANESPDATLICPKSEAQRVKELVGKVKEKFQDKFQ